jgi:hypothetical protein
MTAASKHHNVITKYKEHNGFTLSQICRNNIKILQNIKQLQKQLANITAS